MKLASLRNTTLDGELVVVSARFEQDQAGCNRVR